MQWSYGFTRSARVGSGVVTEHRSLRYQKSSGASRRVFNSSLIGWIEMARAEFCLSQVRRHAAK